MPLRYFAIIVLLGCAVVARAATDARRLDLAAGPLSQALLELGKQFEISIVFAPEQLAGIEAAALEGEFTAVQSLDRLLAGTCLKYEFVREQLIAIMPGCAAATVAESLPSRSASPAPDLPITEELIVRAAYVTGARIRNPQFNQSMPVEVIDQPAIVLSGHQMVSDLLRYVPAVSGNSTSTLISNGGDGTATVTLRGLPASNTLVLLNGRRLNPDALYGKAVDLNTIPLAMVERIEILKDGVSAIYGSDAVAGVVNVITKRDVRGLHLAAYRGGASRGDLNTQTYTLIAGKQFTNGSVQLGINYFDQTGIHSRDRRLSRSSDDRAKGGIDKRSSATIPGRVELPDGPRILMDGRPGAAPTDFREASSEDRYEFRDFTSSIVPSRLASYFLAGEIDLHGGWTAYFDGFHTRTKASSEFAPTPIFSGFESVDLTVSASNIYNPFGVDVTDVRRRVAELPPRLQRNESVTERAVLGIGHAGDHANLNLTLQSSATRAQEYQGNSLHAPRLQAALSADCVTPCVPVNLFGPSGSITPIMLDYIGLAAQVDGTSRTQAALVDVDASLVEMPAGALEFSGGTEYRREWLDTRPDDTLTAGWLIGGANRGPIGARREILEAFAEFYVPLLRGRPWIHRLDVHLAGRWSNYSDFGRTFNPRILVNYEPVHDLILRGSIARGFRAPTLLQLHADSFQSFEQLNDPCSVAQNVTTKPGCRQLADPTLTQFLTINGGNPRLDPERSHTTSVGLYWSKQDATSSLSMSMDWYRIDQQDVVTSSVQNIINANADANRYSDRVIRDLNGNITQVNATYQNIGVRDVEGLDFTANWRIDTAQRGVVTFALNATHIMAFEDKFDVTTPSKDHAGRFSDDASGGLGALPDWKVNLGLSWQYRNVQGRYNIYHVSSLVETVPILETNRTIDSWTTHNVNLSYLGAASGWSRLTLGANNLFDTSPPFAAAAFNDSYDGRTYDLTGRYLYVKIDKSF